MRSLLLSVFLLTLFRLAVPSAKGQEHYFKHYQADDGLAHNSVTAIIQDQKGLIWIGTRGGLSRFDAYNFRTFQTKNNKFGNVGNRGITSLCEDLKGIIWIGTGKGLYWYNQTLDQYEQLLAAPSAYIDRVLADQNNNIWFTTKATVYCFNQKTKTVEDLKIKGLSLALDHSYLWIGDQDGQVTQYNTANKSKKRIQVIGSQIPENLRSISRLLPIAGNQLLIGCFKQGLKVLDCKTNQIRPIPLQNADGTAIYVRDIIHVNKDEYWIATESGIYIYNLLTNKSTHLQRHADDPYSIADNAVYALCKDIQGGIWAGTFFSGLNYYSNTNARFKKYYPVAGTNSISGYAIREICSDNKGNLWIGTEDAGINRLDRSSGLFKRYATNAQQHGLSYPNIHGLLAVGNKLFIGPFFSGLEIMDMQTGSITERYSYIGDKSDQSYFVLSVYLTRDSTLLIGTGYSGAGLFSFDQKRKKFERIKEIPRDTYVFDIEEDYQGNIWTGSVSQGAYYYHPKTGKHGNIRFGKTDNSEFAVTGILEDRSHALWFTTEGGGLIKLSADRKQQKKFTTENGLPTNILYRALEDDAGHLWISSINGLICFDVNTEKTVVYTKSNGLLTNQFNFSSAFKNAAGRMYFGSAKGLISFDPPSFKRKVKGPPIYITGIQINNQEIAPKRNGSPLQKAVLFTDSVKVKYNQNNISIEFAALDFASPEATRYEYLMEGLDRQQTVLSKNRKAYYTDLSPGDYTFRVKARSNVNSWSGEERRLFIRVYPPFWQSWLAYLCYGVVIVFGVFAMFRQYHKYIGNKNKRKQLLFEHRKEKEIYQAKIEFFTNIAHEIQTPITLILGPVELMIRNARETLLKSNLLMVQKYARRLSELTNQLLDFRKTEMDQFGLNFVNLDIGLLLNEQVSVFRQEAERSQIDLALELAAEPVIAFADREALLKIFTNLTSNAVKYAASRVAITLIPAGPEPETFSVRFENDGQAIPSEFRDRIFEPFFRLRSKDKPGTGIGLSLTKSLAELHRGKLVLLSGESDRIIFELILPYHQQFEFTLSTWKKIE